MANTIAERLSEQRRRSFVGREHEKEVVRDALAANELPFLLFYGYGPGGVGKTSLLREFAGIADELDIPAYFIDARNVPPNPESCEQALIFATESSSLQEARAKLARRRSVLFVDTFENLHTLEGWFREEFLPSLPDNILCVVMGRRRPSNSWISDDAWRRLAKVVGIRNLSDSEVISYLKYQGVPSEQHQSLAQFTYGHPLALSLACETLAQDREARFELETKPDIINLLLERFLDHVPSELHRQALEASAMLRNTTQAMIASLIDEERSYELFEWLKSLTFMEAGPLGIYPHDLARESISMELKWRNVDALAKLHDRARAHYADNLERSAGAAQQAIISDYIYLHRNNPAVKPFFNWDLSASYVDSARPADRAQILEMIESHEGGEAAKIAEMWLDSPFAFTQVLRNSSDPKIGGFLMTIEVSAADKDLIQKDPGAVACMNYLEASAPLRTGEGALIYRYWMSREGYQDVSPDQSLLFVTIVYASLTTPKLAHTFQVCSNPDFYLPMFEYASVPRIAEADFSVEGRSFGVYGHDWRAFPIKAWLDLLSEREVPSTAGAASPSIPVREVVVLSRPGFESAVVQALRSFTNGTRLSTSPLLASRLVLDRVPADSDTKAKVRTLRETLYEQGKALASSSKEAKLFAALASNYFKPARSQEAAAEQVDVSIATYRRHLKAGVARMVEALWQIETGG